jgi:hypothetical protein
MICAKQNVALTNVQSKNHMIFNATARMLPARYREGKIRAITSTTFPVFACY